ncbi:MAG TPA: GNAT family N-acetyltransferase [Candidatus Onthomorpha intestinigallinarum]|uniref:GNAT family N-acetyltransferase n=1 Tax=Candidatus Onthomorpha intestinigallinarum TaxID=2840880 RepID=A0A9D1RI93_9BACT|nr:GNAT family N-acetyltransferase [Candidatus Onthomorpha intestinigallinarum]
MAKIRKAVIEDCSAILGLIKDLALYEKAPDEVEATEETLVQSIFVRKEAEVVLLEEGNEVLGFALYFFNFSTWKGRAGLYLEDLFVREQYRGKGYGKMLLSYLATIAKEKGCPRFEWIVLDWNTPSIDFYKAMGAVPLDTWTVFRLNREGISKLASEYKG